MTSAVDTSADIVSFFNIFDLLFNNFSNRLKYLN
jgi:hypothetical protein